MSGWHSSFQNDVNTINGVTNFFVNEMKTNNGEEDDENDDSSISEATIAVMLAGPMTSDQKAMTQSKTNACPSECQKGINWMRKWTLNYNQFITDKDRIIKPIIINETETVDSINSNVEKEIITTCVFPEAEQPIETSQNDLGVINLAAESQERWHLKNLKQPNSF